MAQDKRDERHDIYPSYHYLARHCPETWLRSFYRPYKPANLSDVAYWADLALTFDHDDAVVMEQGKVKGIVIKATPPDWLQRESQGQSERGIGEWSAINALLVLYWTGLLALGIWSAVKEWRAWWRVRKKTREVPSFDLEARSAGTFGGQAVCNRESKRNQRRDNPGAPGSMSRPVVHVADVTSTIEDEGEGEGEGEDESGRACFSNGTARPPPSALFSAPKPASLVRAEPRLLAKKYAVLFLLLLALTLHVLSILYVWQSPTPYARSAATEPFSSHASSHRTGWLVSGASCALVYYFLFQLSMLLLILWHAVPIFRWTIMVQLLKRPPSYLFWYLVIALPILIWCGVGAALTGRSVESDGAFGRESGFPVIDTFYWTTTAAPNAAQRVRVCYIATWSLAMKAGLAIPVLLFLSLVPSLILIARRPGALAGKRMLSRSKKVNLLFSILLLCLYGFAMLGLTGWHRKKGLRWAYEILFLGVMTLRLAIEVRSWLVYLLGRVGGPLDKMVAADIDHQPGDALHAERLALGLEERPEPVVFCTAEQQEPSGWNVVTGSRPPSPSSADTDAMGIAGLPPFPSSLRPLVQRGLDEEPGWESFRELPAYASSYIKQQAAGDRERDN